MAALVLISARTLDCPLWSWVQSVLTSARCLPGWLRTARNLDMLGVIVSFVVSMRRCRELQVKGQAKLNAPRDQVWRTLLDAGALQSCLPGCQRFESIGEREWEASLTVGMAGIKGTYLGRVAITDMEPETSYRLSVEGSGGGNRIRGSGVVRLADASDGGTEVSYDGDAHIAGTLAAVGQRLFQPAARMMAEQFFRCMGSRVGGESTEST